TANNAQFGSLLALAMTSILPSGTTRPGQVAAGDGWLDTSSGDATLRFMASTPQVMKFFPRQDVAVQICDIRHDAKAVICQNTDTLAANADYGELLGFKYNIRPTAFILL